MFKDKARLVDKGYDQEKEIDYDVTIACIAGFEATRMSLTFVSFIDMKLNKIYVKYAFLMDICNKKFTIH